MTIPPDPNELLMGGGGGGRSAFNKHTEIGTVIGGEVVAVETRQQTEFGTGALLFWDDGRERWQVVVTVQTDLREDADDDGLRRFYLKGGKKSETTEKAAADAVAAAGATTIEVGGSFHMALTGHGTASKPGLDPPKQYAAQYQPPVKGVDLSAVFPATQQPPAPAPVDVSTSTAAPAPAAAPWPGGTASQTQPAWPATA